MEDQRELLNGIIIAVIMHLSIISPIPPTWGWVGDMWGLGHTICALWWGKVQLTVWGSKFNFFNVWHAFTVKKIPQGWGWGNGGGKATAVMPHGGGGLSLIGAFAT